MSLRMSVGDGVSALVTVHSHRKKLEATGKPKRPGHVQPKSVVENMVVQRRQLLPKPPGVRSHVMKPEALVLEISARLLYSTTRATHMHWLSGSDVATICPALLRHMAVSTGFDRLGNVTCQLRHVRWKFPESELQSECALGRGR